ncbi:MAG: hypothetical protein AMXMBFR13_50020 [Phycisphaerae bacterium]|jgi:hypothetical protein
MTLAGWLFMLLSCGGVIGLTAFCYYRVLTCPRDAEHMHAPLEIDTRDQET